MFFSGPWYRSSQCGNHLWSTPTLGPLWTLSFTLAVQSGCPANWWGGENNENKQWWHICVGVIGLRYSTRISSSNFWMVFSTFIWHGKCSFTQRLFFPWRYKSGPDLSTQHKGNVYNRKMEFNSCSHSDINILICSFNSALLLKSHISIMRQFRNTWGSPADLYTNSCKSHSVWLLLKKCWKLVIMYVTTSLSECKLIQL